MGANKLALAGGSVGNTLGKNLGAKDEKGVIGTRQLCFFVAFLLPVSKLLETPSVLAYYAKGDLLFPAICQQLLQALAIGLFLFLSARTDKSFFELIESGLGRIAAKIIYIALAVYFVFYSLLPLLEFERFVYTAFFDAAPTFSAFLPFFLMSAYVCTKGLKAFARSADLAMPLFIVSFVGLMVMSVGESDFSAVLPLFGTPISSSFKGFLRSMIHFSDSALLLPMLGAYRYKKGDGKKVMGSYALGSFFVLFFLVVFYGLFGPLSPIMTFAFDKTAQYFKALNTVGRIDLMLAYTMTILLIFYYCLPLQLGVICFSRAVETNKKIPVAAALNLALLLFTAYFAKFYTRIYNFVTYYSFWVFPVFAYLLPLFALFLVLKNRGKRMNGGGMSESDKKTARKEDGYATC
ncbi:MAG: GerAB/ArcD/ProY family transporter [Clostridia bacterium]|nr:GerAB/ArcD/ProY family transporter [Clostridia bacterium]